jgi:coenzyme F420-reducing hydrogenase delta subunit/ferredoxin
MAVAAHPRAEWEPRIVALVCNWCTYSGADMAGTARRTYAPNVRIVRLPCTGRLDPLFVVKAFENGADAVIASGCHPGDCHYVQGNMLARRRLTVFRALMDFLGLDRGRLHFAWVSASEGVKWASVVDEVTETVRELGPVGEWAAPAGATEFALPDPGPEPRTPPSADENERVSAQLRETARALLEDGTASVVIGYTAGSLPGQMVPAFASAPDQAGALAWNERCANNLAVYVPEAVKRRVGGKVALAVKSCDAKAVAGLLREHQVTRDDVLLLGVRCDGVWTDGSLALKCYACEDEVSPLADVTVAGDGAHEGAVPSERPRAVAPDPREAQIAALEKLPPAERDDWWQRHLDRCLRCYACRAVCPLCYCETCLAEKSRPQWISQRPTGPGNTAWNVTRAMHLAGRCVGCDECTRVCPADIRLDLINRRVAQEVEGQFDYRAGVDASAPPPLATFRPDDPDEFL